MTQKQTDNDFKKLDRILINSNLYRLRSYAILTAITAILPVFLSLIPAIYDYNFVSNALIIFAILQLTTGMITWWYVDSLIRKVEGPFTWMDERTLM